MENFKLDGKNGYESMKSTQGSNIRNIFIWVLAGIIDYVVIRGLVIEKYQSFCVAQSMNEFQNKLFFCFAWTLCLAGLWWWSYTNQCGLALGARLRVFFEEYSFYTSLLFDVLEWLGVLIIYTFFGNTGVIATNGRGYSIICIYALPVIFMIMMYARPPVNIEKVILPVREEQCRITRGIIAVVALMIVVGLFAKDLSV